ncbi:hypothetical protein AB4Z09_24070 [Rhodococcus sp. TAF43]|uniref:hypothetical protein n=1 Tax=Rhodococcus sp. TAF43 TaxID=3237483 RepID=UPI003F97A070
MSCFWRVILSTSGTRLMRRSHPFVGRGRLFVFHAASLCLTAAVGISGACTHVLGGLRLPLAIVVRGHGGLVGRRSVPPGIRGRLPARFTRRDRGFVLEGALASMLACAGVVGSGVA